MESFEQLVGSVDRITFHNIETGFCVLKVKVKGSRNVVTVIGNLPSISPGEYIETSGFWVNDKKHGLQFKAKDIRVSFPSTLEGIQKYLGSGMIKGIGPRFAKKLVQTFGEEIFNIIEKEPNKLKSLHGIGEKRVQKLTEALEEQKSVRKIMVFLQSYGVGSARAFRIFKMYKDKAIEIISENPFRLSLDIHGIGFKTADEIAQKLNIDKNSSVRIHAGLHHVLQQFASCGNCAVFKDTLVKETSKLLEVAEDLVASSIDSQIKEKNIISENIEGKEALFLPIFYYAEDAIAKNLYRIKNYPSLPWGEIDVKKAISQIESRENFIFSKSQKIAIEKAVKSKIMVITGGPGVGKTTIINSILKIVPKDVKIALCAPTGRAAKRLFETTGIQAKTIHRFLDFDPKAFSFRFNLDNPLNFDLIIIDEASMLDALLMNSLLKAIPDHASVLMVGDINQLPSVGAGSVLSDIIKSKEIPVVELNEIFRQAQTSRIIVNSHRINNGEFPFIDIPKGNDLTDFYMIKAEGAEEIHDKLIHVVTKRIPQRFGFDPIEDIQILTPMNRGGLGARSLNVDLQQSLNGKSNPKITRFGYIFSKGDKIIQLVNNYDKSVFNGDIGNVYDVNIEDSFITVNFENRFIDYEFGELDEISLAYAISIHKSQGSEYPVVVIPLSMQHYMMLARNLIYTAITRGKHLVVIIGEVKALSMAINNNQTTKRLTNLKNKLLDI